MMLILLLVACIAATPISPSSHATNIQLGLLNKALNSTNDTSNSKDKIPDAFTLVLAIVPGSVAVNITDLWGVLLVIGTKPNTAVILLQ